MKLDYLKNVVKLTLDKEKCTGCHMCTEVCPHNVFKIENKKALIINKNLCMECGACMQNCPAGAIFVSKGVGCASAVLSGYLNNSEPQCGCSSNDNSCCG